jgi:hypothetical protein
MDRSGRSFGARTLGGIGTLLALSACAGGAHGSPAKATDRPTGVPAVSPSPSASLTSAPSGNVGLGSANPVAVPLQPEFEIPHAGQTFDIGVPLVQIRLGNAQPVWVIVDTEGVGLHVVASRASIGASNSVASGISVSGHHDQSTLGDGTSLLGYAARAVVHIGGVSTASEIPIQLVTREACAVDKPHCAGLRRPGDSHLISGYMGIGLRSEAGPPNPLLSLPPPYNHSWSITMYQFPRNGSGGSLVLGAAFPHPAATMSLTPSRTSRAGARSWQDRTRMCWRTTTFQRCGTAEIDSGSDDFTFSGFTPARASGDSTLPAGQRVNINVPPRQFSLSFLSGSTNGFNRVIVSRQGPPNMDTSVAFFYTTRVTYDAKNGRIALG